MSDQPPPTSPASLADLRIRLALARRAEVCLTSLGLDVPAALADELDMLQHLVVDVPVRCLVCRCTFGAPMAVDSADLPHGMGICGPCDDRTTREVLAERAQGRA